MSNSHVNNITNFNHLMSPLVYPQFFPQLEGAHNAGPMIPGLYSVPCASAVNHVPNRIPANPHEIQHMHPPYQEHVPYYDNYGGYAPPPAPPVPRAQPKKRLLEITDPQTGNIVDLSSVSNLPSVNADPAQSHLSASRTQPKAEESPLKPVSAVPSEQKLSNVNQPADEVPKPGTQVLFEAVKEKMMTEMNELSNQVEQPVAKKEVAETPNKTEKPATEVQPTARPTEELISLKDSDSENVSLEPPEHASDNDEDEEEFVEIEAEGTGLKKYAREFILSRRNVASNLDLVQYKDIMSKLHTQKKYGSRKSRYAHTNNIILPRTILVKRVEGAFVPSRLRDKESDGEVDKLKKLSSELNIILNRVSDSNLTETLKDIKELNINTPEELDLLAETTFQKCIRQPKYSQVFANLCKNLKNFQVPGSESFSFLILKYTQQLFDTPLDTLINELNATIDAKIASQKDEAVKRILEDDRETNISKKKDSYFGNITFIAELYLARVMPVKTITECLKKLYESNANEALPAMLTLLDVCGRDLDQAAKNVLDMCFARLKVLKKSKTYEPHMLYRIQELIELRARGWENLDNSQTQSQPQIDTLPRRNDEKNRRSHMPPVMDTKRKSIQPNSVLKPCSLTVTHQSSGSRKFAPPGADWTQGSGPHKSLSGDSKQGSMQNKLDQSSLLNSRSRESSPRVPVGPQGAWAVPLPEVSSAKQKVKRDFEALARAVVEQMEFSKDSCEEIVLEIPENERHSIIHFMLESVMDKKASSRITVGNLFVEWLDKGVFKESDLVTGCGRYFENWDEDWLSDYPSGFELFAQILQPLIREQKDYVSLLLKIVIPVSSELRAATVVAHCFKQASSRLNEDELRSLCKNNRYPWKNLGFTSDLNEFVSKFTVKSTNPTKSDDLNFDSKLKSLTKLVENSANIEEISNFFRRMPVEVPKEFVKSCMRILLESPINSRTEIGDLALSFGILIDHKPEREQQVLISLQENVKSDRTTSWLLSLIEKEVISSDAVTSWRKVSSKNPGFHELNEIISKNASI